MRRNARTTCASSGLIESRMAPYHRSMAFEKLSIFKDIWDFLRVRKKWWLAPILLILIPFGLLLIFAQTSALAPFIYTLF